MKKYFHNLVTSFVLALIIIVSAVGGTLVIKEIQAFKAPGGETPNPSSGVLEASTGIIGNPATDGIPLTQNVFDGQKRLKSAIDNIPGGGGGGGGGGW